MAKKSHLPQTWPIEKWRNISWTDESKVNLFGSDRGKRQCQTFSLQFTVKTVRKAGGSIMVWGNFS